MAAGDVARCLDIINIGMWPIRKDMMWHSMWLFPGFDLIIIHLGEGSCIHKSLWLYKLQYSYKHFQLSIFQFFNSILFFSNLQISKDKLLVKTERKILWTDHFASCIHLICLFACILCSLSPASQTLETKEKHIRKKIRINCQSLMYIYIHVNTYIDIYWFECMFICNDARTMFHWMKCQDHGDLIYFVDLIEPSMYFVLVYNDIHVEPNRKVASH